MREDETKEFDFDENDADRYSDAIFQDEMKELRFEKLNQRVTIITILIPCLIGVILFIAYRDITGRVTESEFSGSKEVQTLSAEMEKKITGFTEQNSEFQATLTAKIAGIEKAATGLDQNLKTLNESLIQVKQDLNKTGAVLKSIAASKADKKDQKAAIEKINNTLIPIRKDLEGLSPLSNDISALSSEIKTLSSQVKEKDKLMQDELASVRVSITKVRVSITKMNQDLAQFQSNLKTLGNEKMDRASLELEMLKARKSYERTLDQELIQVQRRIDTLLKRTKRLETNLKQLEATATTIPTAKVPGQSKSPKGVDIDEQDLKE